MLFSKQKISNHGTPRGKHNKKSPDETYVEPHSAQELTSFAS